MKKLLLIFFFSLSSLSQAQNPDIKRTWHWYFGDKAGLDFSSGNPVAVTNSQMDFVLEGCVSISDTSGNLLFYSDGWKVWNKNHQVMPNGTGLIIYGAPTTSQILAVPKPENTNIYYIFSLGYDSTGFDVEWRYTIVDMTLQGGLGDVVSKRNFLCNNATETITAVKHANNNDIWIITMQRNTNSFYSYLLTNTGLNTTPAISNAGPSTDRMIYLEASPDGTKLAVAFAFNGPEILDFDKATGIVSNSIIFPPLSGQSASYGPEFSPDNKKLYFVYMLEITPAVTWTNPVYQIDLTGTSSQILNSKVLLDSFIVSDSFAANFNDNFTSALQLGPDYKIYGAKYTRSKVSVINSPNTLGVGCNFIDSAVYLQGKICYFGLPNFMNDWFFDSTLISIAEVSELQEPIICYPNPFIYSANIIIPSSLGVSEVELFDLLGRKTDIKKKITKENTQTIDHCGQFTNSGNDNVGMGSYCLNNNALGNLNVFVGKEAGYNTGVFSADDNNVGIGNRAGYNQRGTFNTYLGAFADEPTSSSFTNMTAVGANAIVTASNKMILGNNNVNVGIGLSNDQIQFGPQNKVEINAIQGTVANNDVDDVPGASGLRFRDLTANSTPVSPPPTTNVLSLDANGDVIVVPGGGGFGALCSSPTPFNLTGNTAVGLNGFNFHFNDGPNAGTNSVGIGMQCITPAAKLQIRNTTQSIGMQVNTVFSATDVYGIITIAGGGTNNYGIFASDGYPAALVGGNHAGVFNGDIYTTGPSNTAGYTVVSDRKLKKDTVSFTEGLTVIREINPISFRYNGKAGMDTAHSHIGIIAEALQSIAPFALDSFSSKLDSTDAEPTLLFSIKNEAIIYTSLNAIKQLDSAVTQATAPPSAPVLISPANGAAGNFSIVTFTWHSVSAGVVLYRAQAATDNAFTNIIIDQRGITDTAFSAGFCDTVSTTYFWRVSAQNNAGAGPFSQVFSFTDTAKCIKTPAPVEPAGTEFQVGFASASDANWKTNIAPLTDALSKVNALAPITYNWDITKTGNMIVNNKTQIGLIAQEVEQVVPEVVYTDSNGMKYIDYGRLSALLIGAVKELQTSNARTNENGQTEIEKIKLSLPDAPVLGDARPNPNSDYAEIPYYLPDGITSAKIIFIDMLGRTMQEKNLSAGYGIIGIGTNDLPSGTYYYSLIINGNKINSKTIVKTK